MVLPVVVAEEAGEEDAKMCEDVWSEGDLGGVGWLKGINAL